MDLSSTAARTLRRYRKAVEQARLRCDRDGLHKLRVRMKRARSLLRFLAQLEGDADPPKGALRRTTELFRAAGAVREAQINLVQLKDLHGVAASSRTVGGAHLRRKEQVLRKRLQKALQRLRPEDFQRLELHALRVLHGRTKAAVRAAARAFIRTELHHATRLTRAADAHLHLHEVRKHLKHVLHLFDLLDPGIPRPAGLSKVLDRLGDWHDAVVLREALNTLRDHPLQRNELLTAVETRLHAIQTDVLHRLHALLGDADHSPRKNSQRTPIHRHTRT
jgi:CHAD domain-containing protein